MTNIWPFLKCSQTQFAAPALMNLFRTLLPLENYHHFSIIFNDFISSISNPVNAMATIHLQLCHLVLIVDYDIQQLNDALKRGDEKQVSAMDETDRYTFLITYSCNLYYALIGERRTKQSEEKQMVCSGTGVTMCLHSTVCGSFEAN